MSDEKFVSPYISNVVKEMSKARDTLESQKILEKALGIQGIERRNELHELLVLCWYRLAHVHTDMGWFTNNDELLVKLERALTSCKNEIHVNHCCELGLVYQPKRLRSK